MAACASTTVGPPAADAAADIAARDVAGFVDVLPRSSELPCDGAPGFVPVALSGARTTALRQSLRARALDDGIIFSYRTQAPGEDAVFELAFARDLRDATLDAAVVGTVPTGGVLALVAGSTAVAPQLVLSRDTGPRPSGAAGFFGRVHATGAVDSTVPYEIPGGLTAVSGAVGCDGGSATVFVTCDAAGVRRGVVAVAREGDVVSTLPNLTPDVLGDCRSSAYAAAACVLTPDRLTAAITPASVEGRPVTGPPLIVSWSRVGGRPIIAPVSLGVEREAVSAVAVNARNGPTFAFFVARPLARVYVFLFDGESPRELARADLDGFRDAFVEPIGAATLSTGSILLAFSQADVISVIRFDQGSGLVGPTAIANVPCTFSRSGLFIAGGQVYFPATCAVGDQVGLVRLCAS